MQEISVTFEHGLGDAVWFAHTIPLYTRRGYTVRVQCTPDKELLFRAAGAEVSKVPGKWHRWAYPNEFTHDGHGQLWKGSKVANGISQDPMPNIGTRAELWDELCAVRLNPLPLIPAETMKRWKDWEKDRDGMIILLHLQGNTDPKGKNFDGERELATYKALLDLPFPVEMLVLDWDKRAAKLANYRTHFLEDLGACSVADLLALYEVASLFVGVDSGPLHLTRMSGLPAIGIWNEKHYPSTYTLPRKNQLNLVASSLTSPHDKYKRVPYSIVTQPGFVATPSFIAELALEMLTDDPLNIEDRAGEVQLWNWIDKLCKTDNGGPLSAYVDRHQGFREIVKATYNTSHHPTIVETGTMRAEEDWKGAGYSTYIFGRMCQLLGGKLVSVDHSEVNCNFARAWCGVFGQAVEIVQADSISWLKQQTDEVDLLYLDSLDTYDAGHAEHCLAEVQAAEHLFHEFTVVAIDDTVRDRGLWKGKGRLAVPYLLDKGWRITHSGYQTLLEQLPAKADK